MFAPTHREAIQFQLPVTNTVYSITNCIGYNLFFLHLYLFMRILDNIFVKPSFREKELEMNSTIQPKTKIYMPRHAFQRVDGVKRGSTLFCDTGVLWVTQAGDRQDYVLHSGQQMTVTKRGKVLVEAMRDADLYVA
jgi:hypothetical protein